MQYSAFGAAPLSYTELAAWQSLTNKQLTPFEAITLRKMSEAYCSMLNTPDAMCPYFIEVEKTEDEMAEATAKALASWKAVAKQI